jgi:hypothetical protein
MSEIVYSSLDEAMKAARQEGGIFPVDRSVSNPNNSLKGLPASPQSALKFEDLPEDILGEEVAFMMSQYQLHGYVPTFKEAVAYRKFMKKKEVDMLSSIGGAVAQTASDLTMAVGGIAGDAATLKVHKLGASVVEGGARGFKNWFYMYEQAKYDEHSFLSKLLYGNDSTDEQYYENLKKAIELNKTIQKDNKEGILLPPKIKMFDTEFDLTNEATVQGLSYVIDPSWVMPNLGVEAAVSKALRATMMSAKLGDQLASAAARATKKTSTAFGAVADYSASFSNAIETFNDSIANIFRNSTGEKVYIGSSGVITPTDNVARSAIHNLDSMGAHTMVKVPMWGVTSAFWGGAKIVEGISTMAEAYTRLAFDEKMATNGLSLSERVAAQEGGRVANVANFYAKSVSPLSNWMTSTAKTALHSGMYGAGFGFAFGGEEGAYHGFGTGIVLGSAFHQIGAFANTVAGHDQYRSVLKNFLWATEHYDYYNQEGMFRLMENVTAKGGEEARWRLMSQIGAFERIQREHKLLILTEERIKQMSSSDEWSRYEKMMLNNAEFGGVVFTKDKNKNPVILINADRAVTTTVNEEMFHSLLLNSRYKQPFVKNTVENLIGTADREGALYKMPLDKRVALLESFRDQYFNLDKTTGGHIPEAMEPHLNEFNRVIEMVRGGERPPELNVLFEEFLAAYWNRFIADKPIDYLIKGGDLGLIRNAVEWGKDMFLGVLGRDLSEAGVKFKDANGNPDLFLIDETTKQRIRVPMLEKLMKQYVKTINGSLEMKSLTKNGMYHGWEVDGRKYQDTFNLINNGLEHLVSSEEIGNVNGKIDTDGTFRTLSEGIENVVDKLQKLAPEQRGTKVELRNDNGQVLATFGRTPKGGRTIPSGFWRDEARKKGVAGAGVSKQGIKDIGPVPKKGVKSSEDNVQVEDAVGKAWAVDKRGQFWESVWQGNPRIVLSGRATNAELEIFKQYLPDAVVHRLNQLNAIIEHAKYEKPDRVTNILRAAVLTTEKELNNGTRIKGGISTRTFIPVELSLYFTRKRKSFNKKTGEVKYQYGEANMLATVIDWDALLTREDYAFNKVDDGDLNYKTVRRLFGTQAELREAVKAMLSNYSLGNRAQAGIKLFAGGKGGERDAALKRDIVNAVIGFHPTKAMENRSNSFWNSPREMQFRQGGDKVKLPTTMTSFRVDHIGTMRAYDGEGFRYNHDEAYKRSQSNFSPAVTSRDHEGNMLPSNVRGMLAESRFRNREGELISVYPLRTPFSEIRVNKDSSVYDIISGDTIDQAAKRGAVRGSMYYSENGWLHFTADPHEAGYTVSDKMRTGYIDTKNHLDISDIGNSGSFRQMVVEVGKRINELKGTDSQDFVKELLALNDSQGNRLLDIFKGDNDFLGSHMDTIESWLFNKQTKSLFEKYGIDSVEYKAVNPNSGSEFSAVALTRPERFVENRTRHGLENYRFSPSKPIVEQLKAQMKKAGGSDVRSLLRYTIDENGDPVFNTRRITEKNIKDLTTLNEMLVADAAKAIDEGKLMSEDAVAKYEQKLMPVVFRELKMKYPEADDEVLKQVAAFSLKGFVDYVKNIPKLKSNLQRPFGATTQVVESYHSAIRSRSGFVEAAAKAGITPESLLETGIPSLGHWVMMSEAEWLAFKDWDGISKKIASQEKAQNEAYLSAMKEAAQYENWLAEFRKLNKAIRTKEAIRAEGSTAVEVERERARLKVEDPSRTDEQIDKMLLKEFPAYRETLKKAQMRAEKLRAQEEVRFERLSDRAKELIAIPKAERKAYIKSKDVRTTSQIGIIQKVLADNNGITGIANNAANTQRELFFLMDETLGGGSLGEKFQLSAQAKAKLRSALVLKTRKMVVEKLKIFGGDLSLKDIDRAYNELVESKRNIPAEVSDAFAMLQDLQRKAESIITEDHAERILDVMSAYGIKELDLDVVEQVRAKIYDEASKGFYELGSMESVARSAELYALYDGGKNKRYIDVRKAIKENFVKALDELEAKGLRGVSWSNLNTSKTNGSIKLGSTTILGKEVLKFDGGEFYIVRREIGAKDNGKLNTYSLLDGSGRLLDEHSFVMPVGNAQASGLALSTARQLFVHRSTSKVNKLTPALAIRSGKLMEVTGGLKDYILTAALKAKGNGGSIFAEGWTATDAAAIGESGSILDRRKGLVKGRGGETVIRSDEALLNLTKLSNKWEVYKHDDLFLAFPVMDEKKADSGRTIAEEILHLKHILKNGKIEHPEVRQGRKVVPAYTEVLTPEKKAQLRNEILNHQKGAFVDLGFTFKLENDNSITIIDGDFKTIAEREAAFADLRGNASVYKAKKFEQFIQKSYLDLQKKLIRQRQIVKAKTESVLSEKNSQGAIPQMRQLLTELHEAEAKRKNFINNEVRAYNRANEARGTGKKESVDAKRMTSLLRDRLDNLSRETNKAEHQYLAIADQLDRLDLLSTREGLSQESIEGIQASLTMMDAQTLQQYKIPDRGAGVSVAEWAANLRLEFRKRYVAYENLQRAHTQLHDMMYGVNETKERIMPKLEFLVKRYFEARGYRDVDTNLTVPVKRKDKNGRDFTVLGSIFTSEENGYTDIKWSFLKHGEPHTDKTGIAKVEDVTDPMNENASVLVQPEPIEKQASRYLADKGDILESPLPDVLLTEDEILKQFRDGMEEIGKEWYTGKDRERIGLERILKLGEAKTNSEQDTAASLVRGLSKQNFDAAELAWLNDPMNRKTVEEIHRRWASETDTPETLIREIRSQTIAATVGEDGVKLKETVDGINMSIRKIGAVAERLRILTRDDAPLTPKEKQNPYEERARNIVGEIDELSVYKVNMPETVEELTAELKALREQKVHLEARYNAILKKAGGRHASPQFRKMVELMKEADVRERIKRRNLIKNNAENKLLRRQLTLSERSLFKQYDDFAKNLKNQNPEAVFPNSRIEISPYNPQTRYLYYAFRQVGFDFLGKSDVLLDMSLTDFDEGVTPPVNSTREGSRVAGQILRNEAKTGRRKIYLADYIHYAINKRKFYEQNTSVPMSPHDAHLFDYFFKKDISEGLFKSRISRIPADKLEAQYAFLDGLIDNFRNNDERSRFIRSFIMDGFDLISNNPALRDSALMNLKGIDRQQLNELKKNNPEYYKKAINTLEVIERAFYLMPDGNIRVTEAGEKTGVKDFGNINYTPQDYQLLRSIEKANGLADGEIRRIVNGQSNKTLPAEAAKFFKKRQIQFRTREEIRFIPVEVLIRMTGFDGVWKEFMHSEGLETSLFGLDSMYTVKANYERMNPQERMALDVGRIRRMQLENRANNMKSAREARLRYKKDKKAILGKEDMDNWNYGSTDSLVHDEAARVTEILKKVAQTEISIQRYKGEITTFMNNREKAVEHMLSLKDRLNIEGSRIDKKSGELVLDWDNPDKPQWRDTIDGRYFIRRVINPKSKKESFEVIFKGETFKHSSGGTVADLQAGKFATVSNITEAQVAIRFFEDDIQRVKVASKMIHGGRNKYDPLSVNGAPLPDAVQTAPAMLDWSDVPYFSKEVLRMYTENNGHRHYREQMADILRSIGQHGETVYIKEWDNGKWKRGKVVITPDKEGIYAKHYVKSVTQSGHTLYIRKKETVNADAAPAAVDSPDKAVTKETATTPVETTAPDKVDQKVADSTNWDIIEMEMDKANGFADWSIIKNKLGYTLMRLKDKDGGSSFRLFNPASMFMSHTYSEIEAMEEVLKQELKNE